ncbi:MAG: hypothetical protein ACKPCM_03585, partial [Pseudanabaena sp.]
EIPTDILQPQSPMRESTHSLSNTFIVIVEIYEEIEQALILGFSRHLQLVKHLVNRKRDRSHDHLKNTENNCQVTLSLFHKEPERLLLYLQNLAPIKALTTESILESSVNITELILKLKPVQSLHKFRQ